MRLNSLVTLLTPAIGQRLPEEGYAKVIDDVVATATNPANIARYNPRADEQRGTQEQIRLATLENAAFKGGNAIPVADTDAHVAHAQTHLQAAAQVAANLQKGGNPVEAVVFLDAVGPHAGLHIQRLAADATRPGVAKVLGEQWAQMAKITEDLKKQLNEQAQQAQEDQQTVAKAQAIQQGQDPDTMLKMAELQAKTQMQQAKTAAGIEMKREKHQQSMALEDAKTASDIRRKRLAATKATAE